MIVKRFIAAAILLGLGLHLGSCGGFSGYVADHWPHWAGGMPDDVPPRPGAPGYDQFIAHGQTDPAAAKSTATGSTAATPTASGEKAVAGAPKASVQPASAAQVAPGADRPSHDSSVINGGLY